MDAKRKNPLTKLKKQLSAQQVKVSRLHEEWETLHSREMALSALANSLTALLQATEPLRALTDGGSMPELPEWQQQIIGLKAGGGCRRHDGASLYEADSGSIQSGTDASSATSRSGAAPSTTEAEAEAAAVTSAPADAAPAPEAQAAKAPSPAASHGEPATDASLQGGAESSGASSSTTSATAQAPSAEPSLPSWARCLVDMIAEHGAEALLERYKGFMGRDLAALTKKFILEAGTLLFRVRGGAPDAGECERRLRSRIDEMFAVCAIVLVARPQSVVELNVLQLDTLEPLTMEWSAERGVFMLQEMQLTKQQALAVTVLLQLYEANISRLLPRRSELMRAQPATATDADEQFDVLTGVAACQAGFVWAVVGTAHALWGGILDATQASAGLVAAYPFAPTLLGILSALRQGNAGSGPLGGAAGTAPHAAARAGTLTPRPTNQERWWEEGE